MRLTSQQPQTALANVAAHLPGARPVTNRSDIHFEIAELHALITPRLTATKAIGQEIRTDIAGGDTT